MRRYALATALLLAPGAALAHTGGHETSGLLHGLAHPLTGPDHVAAMVAVGLLAAVMGGAARLLVPAAFLAMMAVGAGLGMAGVALPAVEAGIALSALVLGLVLATGASLPVAGAMALAGFFALFHGHAHGAELPAGTSGLGYAAGFLLVTAALHGAGLALGRAPARLVRLAGAASAVFGAVILAGLVA